MHSELQFTLALEHGLHARPASVIADAAKAFTSRIAFRRQSTGQAADARSVLSLVALDLGKGDACTVLADGDDAAEAIEAIRGLIADGLGDAVDADGADEDERPQGQARVPAGLRRLGVRWITGQSVSPGFAEGPLVLVVPQRAAERSPAGSPTAEWAKAQRALEAAAAEMRDGLDSAASDLERDLLRAHLGIAEDPALAKAIEESIQAGQSAAQAVRRACEAFIKVLRSSTSAYLRERAIDIEDVGQQILEQVEGRPRNAAIELREPSVVVADLLTPRQLMGSDRRLIKGLILGQVGGTSHTAILARAFGIPTIGEVQDLLAAIEQAGRIMVDADGGFAVVDPGPEVCRYYAMRSQCMALQRKRLMCFVESTPRTRDGVALEVGANISTAEEVEPAIQEGAHGIGLFRTEMLFLDRPTPPHEQEQYETYSKAVAAADGRPVIIRTLDIGGDKPAPYLRLPREENPFLGRRGVRLYERFPDLVASQLRAIIRASAHGPVRMMVPMVTAAEEVARVRERVARIQDELRGQGVPFDPAMPIGIMVEVPAAALAIDQLAEAADFFSIGTNDLSQYFFAADRTNAAVAALCDPLHPAFLRLLASIADAARRSGRWVGICGEMAGDRRHLPLMVGLGLDEISVAPSLILDLKSEIAELDASACRDLLDRAKAAATAAEVRALLAGPTGASRPAPMIAPELVVLPSEARSKIEAISQLVWLIAAAGRAADAHALEEAIWAREEQYVTGLGFGFAIPHCKSDAVRTPTIAISRLDDAIDWGAADGEPVGMVIMLAIPAADGAKAHMQVLARLARRLMHEEFRTRLMAAASHGAVVDALAEVLAS